MNTETADHMKDVIAFLVARSKDDEEAALAIVGMKLEEGYEPTDEEAEYTSRQVMKLTLGLADFALAEIRVLATLMGRRPSEILRVLGQGIAIYSKGLF